MAKHKVTISVPSGNVKKEGGKKNKSLFTPAKEDNDWSHFILGHVLTGIFLGIGTALGTVAIRGLIKKHVEDNDRDSFLAKGL